MNIYTVVQQSLEKLSTHCDVGLLEPGVWPSYHFHCTIPLIGRLVFVWALLAYLIPPAKSVAFKAILRAVMAVWNVFQALLSTVGSVVLVPVVVRLLSTYTSNPWNAVCHPVDLTPHQMSYVLLFILLKPVELIDTIFLRLKGKPLTFLHVFHHGTVAFYCWHAASTTGNISFGVFLATMNYVVHAIMYGYYYAKTMGVPTPSFVPLFITVIQIIQMIFGFVLTLSTFNCGDSMNSSNRNFGLFIYSSYFVLFVMYAIERYATPKSTAKEE